MPEYVGTEKAMQISEDERTIAILIHVFGLFFGIFSTLGFYLIKKDSEYVKSHVVAALNYHISYLCYILVLSLLCVIFIGHFLFPAAISIYLLVVIIAILKAGKDEVYYFPFSFKFFELSKF